MAQMSTDQFKESYRAIRFRLSEQLSGFAQERQEFLLRHGYLLNLDEPRSFSEKLCWRKIFDRNPLFPIVVDKYAVRAFVERVLGVADAARVLVPLLARARDPGDLPFAQFPENFIVKANHGSGFNLIVRGKHELDTEAVVERCRTWLQRPYGVYLHEWAYRHVKRCVLVEELLSGHDGRPPREYKFHMFDGKCVVIQALESDGWYDGVSHVPSKMPTLTYFSEDWSPIDVSWKFHWLPEPFPPNPQMPRPEALADMLDLARRLSRPFDYMRVDLYDTVGGIRFGELTPYHLAGHGAITPMQFDFELGKHWKLRPSPRRWYGGK